MTATAFVDTNVLLYAASRSPEEASKKARARTLLETTDFGVSAQVLQEFYVNAVYKAAHRLTPLQALEMIERLAARPCVDTDPSLVLSAIALSERYRISYWDAAIVAAAQRLGAETLYTEDLSHGQDYAGVRALNPFLEP